MQKEISQAVIRRMPRYYRYLEELMEKGVEKVSSNELSISMKVTASQIRQDLNNFGGFGQQGYGYNVKYLYDEIGKILGVDKRHNMIIVGAGNMGMALANYTKFEDRGFFVTAIFDINPDLKNKKVRGIPIKMMDELPEYLGSNHIDIAVLTIPKAHAAETAGQLAELGIRAIWNFTHEDFDLPHGVVVENVHLSDSLMELSYKSL